MKDAHHGHRSRLRDRYRRAGADSFQDYELLELLLTYCFPRKDTNGLGHELIHRFKNLQGVFEADPKLLEAVPGLGENSVFLLKLFPDICRRYFEEVSNGDLRLSETNDLIEFFLPYFSGRTTECLFALFLNKNKKLIDCTLQYEGSVNAVEINMDRLRQNAVYKNAAYVIIAHNHFNDPTPSLEDLNATALVYRGLAEFGIQLYDHIIYCDKSGISMRESGHFSKVIEINRHL